MDDAPKNPAATTKPASPSGAAIWAGIAVSACIAGTVQIANDVPGAGSRWALVLLLASPMAVHQLVRALYTKLSHKALSRGRSALLAIISVPSGVLMTVQLSNLGEQLALDRFAASKSALVNKISRTPDSDKCAQLNVAHRAARLGDLKGVAYGTGQFVLRFAGGSIDIDGSTIHYDSTSNAWSVKHNNLEQEPTTDSAGWTACLPEPAKELR